MPVTGSKTIVRISLRIAVQACLILIAFLAFTSSSATGQSTNPFFTPPTFSGTGQALTADVNGDGKPDLLFFDGTVLLAKGDGTFTTGPSWNPPLGLGVAQFAIADFNGDGKPDILVPGTLNSISVLLGNGDGTFAGPFATTVGPNPSSVTAFAVGDLNGDGKPDVVAQVGSGFFSFFGNGDGTFASGIPAGAVSAPVSYSLADFNGDGKLDLLVAGMGVQLGNGDGTFNGLQNFPNGVLSGSSVVGDFDGDGKLDVIVTGANSTGIQLQVLFGNGDGTFRAGSIQSFPASAGLGNLVAADLNGDGKLDLVGSTGSAAQVFIGKGDGTFTPGNFYNAPSQLPSGINGSTSIVVADFNGDKKNDVAAFNTMLLGNGDGTLQGNPAVPGAFGFNALGDFNGDGHPDFAAIGPVQQSPTNANVYQTNLNIWLNDGKNNFAVAHTYTINIASPNLAAGPIANVGIVDAADINGDGKTDLVGWIWDASGLSMMVVLGNGDGTFGAPIQTRVNTASNGVISLFFTLGDVNGDRKPDLLVTAGTTFDNLGTLYVFLGNGDGTFGPASTPYVGAIGDPVVGDFNNDKKMDVITGTANGLAVLLGNGDGTFQPASFISNAACATACSEPLSADFNGDGNLDLIVVVAGGYQVLLGKGDGTFNASPPVTPTPGFFGGFTEIADFNGDGKLDVLTSIGSMSPTLDLVLGNGDGTFGSPLPVTNAGFTFVADFNGDNKLDILELGTNQLVWLFNTSQAAVTPPPPPVAPPDFSVGSGSGGGAATVTAGSTATFPLSLAGSGGFTGTVALTCSVAPAGPACSVAPASVMLSGSAAATATVSVTTTARSGVLPTGSSEERDASRRILWIFGVLLAAAGVMHLFAGTQVRSRRYSWSFATACGAVLLLSAFWMSGCGGGSNPSGGSTGQSGTAAGKYTVTVTAQSGSVSHQTQLTLTVQ